jgi:PAS domain-containing protein
MDVHLHHEELVKGFLEQSKTIFDSSRQGVYLYLDDAHKTCNKNFAALLGYKSVAEWEKQEGPFTALFADGKSQKSLVSAYQNAMEKLIGSTINVTWKRKDGKRVKTTVILVPMSYRGHLFALHFISKTA